MIEGIGYALDPTDPNSLCKVLRDQCSEDKDNAKKQDRNEKRE